jgi:hypothetical protein
MDGSRLRSDLLLRRIVDEGLLLDVERDLGYRLNDTAMSIVALLSEGRDRDAIVERLCLEFEVDRDRCEEAVTRFLGELVSRGLLRAS